MVAAGCMCGSPTKISGLSLYQAVSRCCKCALKFWSSMMVDSGHFPSLLMVFGGGPTVAFLFLTFCISSVNSSLQLSFSCGIYE